MHKFNAIGLLCVLVSATACKERFDYDHASPEAQQAWLESASEGMVDGLKATLPHGQGGVYASMGKHVIYPENKRVEITIEVDSGGENISSSDSVRRKLKEETCKLYNRSEFMQNDITIAVRYKLPGGGTALSVIMSRPICGSVST